MVTRDMPCPVCGHDHMFLDCDWCDCHQHLRNGIYDD